MTNPCIACGACCACFRASFYWAEADDATPGGVPVEYTDKLDSWRRVMRGTNQRTPRCVALQGTLGISVWCSIHPRRSSVCREFVPSWQDGQRNPRCDQARQVHGMEPLAPDAWDDPQDLPRAA